MNHRDNGAPDGLVHISSLIVHVQPEYLSAVRARVEDLGGEISAEDPSGKLIVVIETADESGVTGFADTLRNMEGVFLTNLVFHSIDDPSADLDANSDATLGPARETNPSIVELGS